MSTSISQSDVIFSITVEMNEEQTRALEALTLYGDDAFLRVFYEHLGKANLQKHEEGLKSLFNMIRNEVPKHILKVDTARRAFKNA